jgi:hypothetical protein
VLSCSYRITDASLVALAPHCPRLESLTINSLTTVGDPSIEAIARSSNTHFRHLEARSCYRVTDKALTALGEHCPNLETVNIQACDYATDAGVAALATGRAKAGHALRSLNLKGLDELTGSCLPQVATSLTQLTSLDLSATKATPEAVHRTGVRLPYAVKAERNALDPATEPVQRFNEWLVHFRRRMAAASTMENLARGFLNRCRYLRLRARMMVAALEIQRVFRGHRGRRYFRYVRNVHLKGMHAATTIQSAFRGWRGRQRAKEARRVWVLRNLASGVITALFRMIVARRKYGRKRAAYRLARRRWLRVSDTALRRDRQRRRHAAATKVQRAWRNLTKWWAMNAATDIQRVFRGYRFRRGHFLQRCAWVFNTHRAATIIAQAWRRHRRKKRWKKRFEEIERFELAYRREWRRRTKAARRIQRAYHAHVKHVAWLKEMGSKYRLTQTVITIQCAWRCYRARRAYERRLWEVDQHRQVVLAKWGALAKRAINRKAYIIQRNWRLVMRRWRSAITIQKAYRGHVGRMMVAKVVRLRRQQLLSGVVLVNWSVGQSLAAALTMLSVWLAGATGHVDDPEDKEDDANSSVEDQDDQEEALMMMVTMVMMTPGPSLPVAAGAGCGCTAGSSVPRRQSGSSVCTGVTACGAHGSRPCGASGCACTSWRGWRSSARHSWLSAHWSSASSDSPRLVF